MAFVLNKFEIDVTKWDHLKGSDKWRDNFYMCLYTGEYRHITDPSQYKYAEIKSSKPKEVKVILEPIPIGCQLLDKHIHVAYTIKCDVIYDDPEGMTMRGYLDRFNTYVQSDRFDMGIIWLTLEDIQSLKENPTEDNLIHILD